MCMETGPRQVLPQGNKVKQYKTVSTDFFNSKTRVKFSK